MDQAPFRWLYDLERFGIKLGLESMEDLLGRAGRPDLAYPAVLVGGTNGKGSVAALLDSMLRAAGLRVGLYTSPHLVRVVERIRVLGGDIATDDLGRHLWAIRRIVEAGVADGSLPAPPSFFETMTLAALLAFREAAVDVAVLEVGLGGRLDATNAVDAVVSVIVSIDLDHADRLGDTIEAIAGEKAGIVKPGRPLVSGVRQATAVTVLRDACGRAGSSFVDATTCARIGRGVGGRFAVETDSAVYDDLRLVLAGDHQVENARVAIVALEAIAESLGRAIPPAAVRAGLGAVRWPGRLQWFDGSPRVLLDGAHNPAGAETLAAYLRTHEGPRPVLLFAATAGKDVEGILAPLRGLVDAVVLTRPGVTRAADPDGLVLATRALAVPIEIRHEPREALELARRLAGDGRFVLVAGSLYLVGEILGLLEGRPAEPISM